MAVANNLPDYRIAKVFPISHLTKKDLWLVPVYKKDEKAIFFVDHEDTKEYLTTDPESFNSEDVNGEPYFPLVHLMFAHLKSGSEEVMQDELISSGTFFLIPPRGDSDNEIGWRVSESWYTLVIKTEILNHLRGYPIEKSEFDVFSKSKKNLEILLNNLKIKGEK